MKQSGQQGSQNEELESLRESLSALMDAETDDLELRRLLKELEQNPESAAELLQSWNRYHLAQDVLHERAAVAGFDVASAVAEQLAAEEPHKASHGFTAWQQNLTRIAVAACVALVFALTLQTSLDNGGSAPAVATNTDDSAASTGLAPAPNLLAGQNSGEFSVDPVAEQRLRSYLQGIAIDVTEPVVTEHIQDSPLYRLVNDIQD